MVELWPVGVEQGIGNGTLIQLSREFRHDVIVEDGANDDGVRIGVQEALALDFERFRVERVITEDLKGNLEIVETPHTIGQTILNTCPIAIHLMHGQNGCKLMHAVRGKC